MVSSNSPISATELLRRIDADPRTKPMIWEHTHAPAVALRTLMIETSQKTKMDRALQRLRNELSMECTRQYRLGYSAGKLNCRSNDVVVTRRSREENDHAFARGIAEGQQPPPSSSSAIVYPSIAEHLADGIRSYLECPITMELLKDPVMNTKSGLTYSRDAIERWLRTQSTDPQTRVPTTINDLVPNILVRQIIELYENAGDR